MLGGEKGSVAFHGDHRPAKVATHRKSRNLLDISGIVNGSIEINGIIVSNTTTRLRCSPFEVEPSKDYVSSASFTASSNLVGAVICFYDESMKMLSRTVGNVGRSVTSDAEAKFACISYYGNDSTKVTPLDVLQAQFELGSTATSYEPYGTIEQVISEPAESTQEGTMLTFDRTYNHVAEVSVFGESTQDGTPTPDSPVPIVSRASACVETSDIDGSKASTTDLTALLDGRELRSLPDGTRDELQVRDNGDGTGDVVLVERVREHAFTADDNVSYTMIDAGIRLSFRGLPSSAEEESGTSITKSICEFGNISNAQWYKGVQSGACTARTGYGTVGQINVFVAGRESLSDAISVIEGMKIQYALATPVTTTLGNVTMPETFHDTTHVWEANGADISARVKVFG